MAPASFEIPGGDKRTIVVGRTGSGKTTFAAFLLSWQRFDTRPWVVLDFKEEEIFGEAHPPMVAWSLAKRIPKRGLFHITVMPGDESALENWLWRLWERRNCGLFIDEALRINPYSKAIAAILLQGRSRRIPVIACTQRPVKCAPEFFSEADFFSIFPPLNRDTDRKTIEQWGVPIPWEDRIPDHWSYWYDVKRHELSLLQKVNDADMILARLRERAPRYSLLGMGAR